MSVLFDTNIIVNIIRARNRTAVVNFLNPNNEDIYVSVVSEAEVKSISIRNHWGINRKKLLDNFLDQITLV